tara:strand:- start:329 stop:607 length:279 start_codon:yes stop_codon:yes gene_type:complete
MDKLLYNYFGFNENHIKNQNATLIQDTYRKYKKYNLQKKIDMIHYGNKLTYKTDNKINEEINEENEFWKNQRKKIKNEKINFILKDYEIIDI